jgi:hypothetical protein
MVGIKVLIFVTTSKCAVEATACDESGGPEATHLYIGPRLKIRGAIPPLTICLHYVAIKNKDKPRLYIEMNNTNFDVSHYLIWMPLEMTRPNIPLGVAGSMHSLATCLMSP